MSDQHSELSSPVTDVIDAEHIEAEEFHESTNGISDNGGAQMSDVHFLRDVGGGKVDESFALRNLGRFHTLSK